MRIGQAQFDLSRLIHYVGAYYVRGTMKILMAGDIVGSPGRRAFEAVIARKKADNDVDFVVVKDGLGKVILVDFHAEATSEKVAMGHYLNGRVSAVVGTHTHVQTSDGYVLSKGTAYQTDLGMTGPRDSVIGCKKDAILQSFLTGLPVRFEVASDDVFVEGAIIDVDEATGRARSIQAFREAL